MSPDIKRAGAFVDGVALAIAKKDQYVIVDADFTVLRVLGDAASYGMTDTSPLPQLTSGLFLLPTYDDAGHIVMLDVLQRDMQLLTRYRAPEGTWIEDASIRVDANAALITNAEHDEEVDPEAQANVVLSLLSADNDPQMVTLDLASARLRCNTFIGEAIVQEDANVREGDTTEHRPAGRVKAGDVLPVIKETDNGWYHVLMPDGTYAYISYKMVEFVAAE